LEENLSPKQCLDENEDIIVLKVNINDLMSTILGKKN
jgi:hypothetical protein